MSSFDKDLYSKGASYLVDNRAYKAYVLDKHSLGRKNEKMVSFSYLLLKKLTELCKKVAAIRENLNKY